MSEDKNILDITYKVELPVGTRFRINGDEVVFEIVENTEPLECCRNCCWLKSGWECTFFPIACNMRKDGKDVHFARIEEDNEQG